VLLCELFIFFINIQQQLLGHITGNLVFFIKAGADAKVKRFPRLFLPGTLSEPTSFAS